MVALTVPVATCLVEVTGSYFRAIAVAIPLVIALDTEQFPGQALHGLLLTVLVDRDDVEIADRIFAKIAVEFRLDADPRPIRFDRQRQRALDGAAAGLLHAHGDVGVEQLRRRWRIVDRDVEGRLAVLVQRLQVFERHL